MDIKTKFFKFKRAVHRNREEIAKAISITLTVILVAVVAYGAFAIVKSDRAYAESQLKPPASEDRISAGSRPDYKESSFEKVAENDELILEANLVSAEICVTEKKSGKKWYSNPPDYANDTVAPIKGQLRCQMLVKFFNKEKRTAVEYDNYTQSINKGCMTYKLIEDGVKFTFGFPTANVYIPVQYTLCEDGFQAEIVTSEISGVGDNPYMVESIGFMPYFGAGTAQDDGYLVVPDGSGALINYNNGKHKSMIYTSQVYGTNITLEQSKADTVKERISLPVFGNKCNDNGYIAVITSGDANSSITARPSGMLSSYNTVYPTAYFRDYTLLLSATSVHVGVETRVLVYSDDLMCGKNYAVRYLFVEGEEANYVGMAERYRDFLSERKALKDSKLADDKYLVLDLVGAVSIEKYVFGVKQPVVTALTTYKDVISIVKELKERGVEKLVINYTGALDSGLNNKMFSSVETESALGSKKDFKAMIEYLEKENVIFFLESNPVDLYNSGHGYDNNADSAYTFFNGYAFQHNFELDSLKPTAARWHLLHPAKIPEFVTKYVESTGSWNISHVSLARMGQVLYSDYSEGVPSTTRAHTIELYKQAMAAATKNGDALMVHGGNAYVLGYADVVTDTSTGCSDYDVQDNAVPFYQIAFQGNTVLTPTPLNCSVDYTYEFLKALETGCSLKYNLIYGDVANLVGTEYNTMVSYSYEFWKDIIVEQYLEMQKVMSQFAGEEIVDHQIVAEDVTMTQFESGKIIVNYRDEAFTYEGRTIESRDYIVLK